MVIVQGATFSVGASASDDESNKKQGKHQPARLVPGCLTALWRKQSNFLITRHACPIHHHVNAH